MNISENDTRKCVVCGRPDTEHEDGYCPGGARPYPIALANARNAALEEAARTAETEPELEGDAPEEVKAHFKTLSFEEQGRFHVRVTKKCIAARIRSLKKG